MKLAGLGPGGAPVLGESPRSLLYVTFPRRPRRGAALAPLTLRAGRLPGDGRPPPAAPVRGPGPPENWRPRGRGAACRVPPLLCTDPRLRARRRRPMESRGVSVTPSALLGPGAVAVLAGVPASLLVSCSSSALTEPLPFFVVVGKPQVCSAKGRLMKF